MKRQILFPILICIGIGLFFVSCSKDLDESLNLNHVSQNNEITKQVSMHQAEMYANIVANKMFGDGSEDSPKLKSTSYAATRSASNITPVIESGRDTVMFIVNFGNDLGFMLISADKENNPIIGFSDKGSFILNAIDSESPVSEWVSSTSRQIAESLSQPVDTTNTNYIMWETISKDEEESIELELVSFPTQEQQSLTRGGTRRYSTGKSTVYPFTSWQYQWGQGTGYNYNAPVKDAPAGCPAVAIGLVCIHYWFPSDYYYMGMPGQLPINYNQENAISKMFRSIGDKIPHYEWTLKGTGAYKTDYLVALRNMGYKNAQLKGFELEELYSNLSKNRPVMLRGYKSFYGGGHVWFCDGYSEFVWQVTKWKKKFLGKWKIVDQWYEYADYIYMNWGWNGTGNGWFEQGSFDSGVNGSYNYEREMFVDLYPVYGY